MSHQWRRAVFTLVALAVGWLAMGCADARTGQGQGAVGTAGQLPAAIAVETSSLFVTVENRANAPLLDVTVALKPASGTLFSTSISRLEGSEKRDLSLSEFRSSDGTSFNLRLMRPRQVVVTASDLVGKKYEMTASWKQ
jgi:hypothetical protein